MEDDPDGSPDNINLAFKYLIVPVKEDDQFNDKPLQFSIALKNSNLLNDIQHHDVTFTGHTKNCIFSTSTKIKDIFLDSAGFSLGEWKVTCKLLSDLPKSYGVIGPIALNENVVEIKNELISKDYPILSMSHINKRIKKSLSMDDPLMESEEDLKSPHPDYLIQNSPPLLVYIFSSVTGFISSYGWFIIIASVVCYYFWRNYQPKLEEWRESAEHHKNPDKFIAREVAVVAARQRMQEKYNEVAKESAEKEQAPPETTKQNQSGVVKKLTTKPKLRPEYNPLMGDTSSCAFRPSGGTTGGG